jgi:hypothetical protein
MHTISLTSSPFNFFGNILCIYIEILKISSANCQVNFAVF